MNLDRGLATCKFLLKQLKNNAQFNFNSWVNCNQNIPTTLEEFHKCGMSACGGGYICLSKEWIRAGGVKSHSPEIIDYAGDLLIEYDALQYYFDDRTDDFYKLFDPSYSYEIYDLHSNNVTLLDFTAKFVEYVNEQIDKQLSI